MLDATKSATAWLPSWLKRLAGIGWFGGALAMVGIGEYALALTLLVFSAIAFEIQLHTWQGIPERPVLGRIIKTIAPLAILGGSVFFGAVFFRLMESKPWSNVLQSSPTSSVFKTKTLRDRFEDDFKAGRPVFTVQLQTDYTLTDRRTGKSHVAAITRSVSFDLDTRARIVSFYVPSSPWTPEHCDFLAGQVSELLDLSEKRVDLTFHSLGEKARDIKSTRFAGAVFVYHEDRLSDETVVALTAAYKRNNLEVQFRGPDYAIAQNLYEAQPK